MLELWQTEWCPASRRVRERLNELGVDYVTRQVPVEQEDRTALLATARTDSIPALVVEDGSAVIGEAALSRTGMPSSSTETTPAQ
jgi:glutathione S-transferase